MGEVRHTTELAVSGMTCNNCVRHVRDALAEVPGVKSAEVSLETGSVQVRWDEQREPAVDELISALDIAGYKGKVLLAGDVPSARSRWSPLAGWDFNVFVGLAITAPLMILEWGLGMGNERWYHWFSFLLVLPLQIFGGMKFYAGAWNQLKAGQSNMDTLVSLGSTTAFLYSLYGLLAGWAGHLFFMDSAAIITLVSLGHYLEAKASAQAASSLRALLKLAPEQARKLNPAGQEQLVPVSELRENDLVVLRPGDRVPTDGAAVEGDSTVNESMLTGESLPVEKRAGAKLFAGTLNESGTIKYRVTGTGEETALAHIIQIVQRAQSSRASIQRLGDKISSIFVPIVVVIALGTVLWWSLAPDSARAVNAWLGQYLWHPHFAGTPLASGIFHAAAVLIIACPCAMGLATPVAIMAGTNAAARRGILIRDGAALEKSGRINTVIFDKTGTLTEGKLAVAEVEAVAGSVEETRALAAALARSSNHPLSRAVAQDWTGPEPEALSDWTEVRGSGVQARSGSDLLRLGSLTWLNAQLPGKSGEFVERWRGQGATVIGIAKGPNLAGLFALRDSPKAKAAEVVRELNGKGLTVMMVTGDNEKTAHAIARQLGIAPENVRAEVQPEGKAKVIEQLQAAGKRVAFAGDGINDAPALEQADLGVALMNASDVARESADIILLKKDIEAIPEAIGLAQATLRTIKQNLFWAFFYNAAGVPLAALGFLSPIFSAFAMGASDLLVVGNALRLRWWGK